MMFTKGISMDIRNAIDTTKMSLYQWVIVTVAVFLNALDG
jgi:hypothetical protein